MAKVVEPARPRSWLWLHGLLCGAAISLLPAISMVVVVMLAPAIMMAIVETTPKRPVAAAMSLIAAATTVLPLQTLWNSGNSIETAMSIVTDPMHVSLSWIAAGFAWLIGEASSIVALHLRQALDKHKVTKLTKERQDLTAEWNQQPEA